MGMAQGDRVMHRIMGPGTVRGVLDGGRTLLVAFDARPRAPYLYPSLDFDPLERPAAPPVVNAKTSLTRPAAARTAPARPSPARPSTETLVDRVTGPSTPVDRQSLEALRLGVVPVRGLDRLTVGREEERARLESLFDDGRGMLVVSGGYGSGKTHLLELAEAQALARGWLVARATFDPVEVPPSHPIRVYGALIDSLRYPDGVSVGLRPLVERLVDSPAHASPGGASAHAWLSPLAWTLKNVTDPRIQDAVLELVSGRSTEDAGQLSEHLKRRGWTGPRLLAMPDYRTFGQIMAHLLGGMSAWARDAGWKGLCVLLDEAEYFDQLGATSKEMAENVLRYLAMASLPVESLPFDADDVYRGGHAVHRAVSPVYRPDQPLVVLGTFTPNPQIDAALRRLLRHEQRLDLLPVSSRLFPLLADRVLGMMQEIYPGMDPPPQYKHLLRHALNEAFERGDIETTRQAARLCVEYWDLYRVAPDRAARALRP